MQLSEVKVAKAATVLQISWKTPQDKAAMKPTKCYQRQMEWGLALAGMQHLKNKRQGSSANRLKHWQLQVRWYKLSRQYAGRSKHEIQWQGRRKNEVLRGGI